jgi:hypothetical protein
MRNWGFYLVDLEHLRNKRASFEVGNEKEQQKFVESDPSDSVIL